MDIVMYILGGFCQSILCRYSLQLLKNNKLFNPQTRKLALCFVKTHAFKQIAVIKEAGAIRLYLLPFYLLPFYLLSSDDPNK